MLLPPLPDEFAGAELPDRRLKARLRAIATRIAEFPSEGLPVAFDRESEILGVYRFLTNDRVDASKVLLSHISSTVARCAAAERVLVVHDTTEFAFSGDREGCYRLAGGRRGFCGHFSIAISADGRRRPLGALAYATVKRREERQPGRSWQEAFEDPDKESLRWMQGVVAASEHVGGRAATIHVMDREGDSWELLEKLMGGEHQFVVRMTHDRVLSTGGKVSATLADAPLKLTREVELSERGGERRPPAATKKHPPRLERAATLGVSAVVVQLRRPTHIGVGPDSLPLHVVHVRELETPPNAEPVDWRLLTNLPIDDAEQIAQIVDIYRTRWLIEEFFKALKTGCSFLKRQAESLTVLERILALYTAAAWRLLALRWISRSEPDAPATTIVTPVQLSLLQDHARRTKFSSVPTAGEAAAALAELGGHMRQNGPPGWQVLGRGFDRLTERELGWFAAVAAMAKSQGSKDGVEM